MPQRQRPVCWGAAGPDPVGASALAGEGLPDAKQLRFCLLLRKRAVCPPVPVLRIPDVALDFVQHGVNPCRQLSLKVLDDLVSAVPLPAQREVDGLRTACVIVHEPVYIRFA